MKVDELITEERQCRESLANRSGVLGLMLHSTFNHELDGRWQAMRKQQQQHKKHNQKPTK